MLDCIQHLAYYMMVEVIEPNWLTFLNKMSKVSNVDDVLSVHQDLQDSYLKECMLTDPNLLGCITLSAPFASSSVILWRMRMETCLRRKEQVSKKQFYRWMRNLHKY